MEAMVNAGFFPSGYAPFGMQKVVANDAIGFHKPDREPLKRLVAHPACVFQAEPALPMRRRMLAAILSVSCHERFGCNAETVILATSCFS